MRRPRQSIEPLVGSISFNTALPVVDLPQPLSPTSPSVSPAAIEKLTSSTACTCPVTRPNTPLRTG